MRPEAPVRAIVEIRNQKGIRTITNTTARHKKLSPSLRRKCARNQQVGQLHKFVTKSAPAQSQTPPQCIKKHPVLAMVQIRDQKCIRTITNTTAMHQNLSSFSPPKYARKHKFGPGSVLATSRQPEVKMRPNIRPFLSHCPPLLLLSCSIRPNVRAMVQIRDKNCTRTITNTTAAVEDEAGC